MSKHWFYAVKLDSSLPVLISQTASPSVSVVLMVKTGSKYEKPQFSGISHFLEHYVFKGTTRYPRGRDIMRAIDVIGADHNAATGKETTTYWVKTSKDQLEKALEVISEIVFHPTLPPNLLSQEKGTILQEIAMYEDLPMSKVGDLFEELMFGKTSPLGRPIIGSKETITRLTVDQLIDYKSTWYQPSHMALGIAGGVTKGDVLRYVSKYFDSLQSPSNSGSLIQPPSTPREHKRLRTIQWRRTDQAHLAMGMTAIPRRDTRRYVFTVLSTILGGNTSSQLFEEIREQRGLAYYIRSGVHRYEEAGYLVIRAGVRPDQAEVVEELLTKHVSSFSFADTELSESKGYIKGQLALEWEDSQAIAEHLAQDHLFEDHIRSQQEIESSVLGVTRKQVDEIADEFLRSATVPFMAAIGPIDRDLRPKQ